MEVKINNRFEEGETDGRKVAKAFREMRRIMIESQDINKENPTNKKLEVIRRGK